MAWKKKQGVVVVQVKRGSSADQAGLEPGDIVLEADGKKVLREEDLQVVIGDCVAGQTISLSILRNDETIVKKLKMLKPKN
jgi:serine protease Do